VQRIELGEGAYLELDEHWLAPAEAEAAFAAVSAEVSWEARAIRVFGREVMQPRLVRYVGDPDAAYTYSGVRHEPAPWTPALARLRAQLRGDLGIAFNAVLCNLYRDGRDAMGMHSDAEPELGPEPVIASVSLGATRRFLLRSRRGVAPEKLDLWLPSGSLLVMRGTTQRQYRHGLPRAASVRAPRINLTFRCVFSSIAGTIDGAQRAHPARKRP
jgi:alkylated DNA repair dioxygenase AlkB